MGKSLRSKRKRMLRAIKRERYAKKELAQLKKTLGITDGDVEMSNISDIAKVVDAKAIQKKNESPENEDKDLMETDVVKSKHNRKTLRNEHGNYPVWLSSREVKKRVKFHRINKRKQKRNNIKEKRRKGNTIRGGNSKVEEQAMVEDHVMVEEVEEHSNNKVGEHVMVEEVEEHASSKVEEHTNSKVEDHASSKVEEHTSSKVEEHTSSKVEEHTSSKVKEHTNSKVEDDANSKAEEHTNSKVEEHVIIVE